MSKIGVLTYDLPHRKTHDLLFRLKAFGYDDTTAIILPFVGRPMWQPIYQHRPELTMKMAPQLLCERLGFNWIRMRSLVDLGKETFDAILIGGTRILTKKEIGDRHIINAHPGYLPYARGLDALKWAIYYDIPIGVSTHIINEEPDSGYLIERRRTPLYHNDSLYSLAMRHYWLEIEMLVEALSHDEKNIRLLKNEITDAAGMWVPSPVRRRMPPEKEVVMMKRLESRLENLHD